MLTEEINRTVMELPVEERLDLARRLVESVVSPADIDSAFAEGIRRIEAVASGRVTGLSEKECRAATG